jgi:transposase-like protein
MSAPHPVEFRQRAVELARTGDKPVAAPAKDLGIGESCLRNWMAQGVPMTAVADRSTTAEKREFAELAGVTVSSYRIRLRRNRISWCKSEPPTVTSIAATSQPPIMTPPASYMEYVSYSCSKIPASTGFPENPLSSDGAAVAEAHRQPVCR